MPCPHKFQQYLTLERLDFEPTTLIVGTFNPAWPVGNAAKWFYGRTRNNYLWDVLPRLYNPDQNLRQANAGAWKEFCSGYGIALTDVIACINDAEEENEEHRKALRKYLDTSIADYFQDFEFTNIVELLQQYPTIQNVYLTRQPGVPLFDEQWAIVQHYANQNGLYVQNLLTPSASARFQIRPYRQANPNDATPLRNFIHQSWQQQWHF